MLRLGATDLSPRLPKKAYGGEGGFYHGWSPKELAMLEKADIGAAKLVLEENGLALPSFSNSAKTAYVLRGTGRCGIVLSPGTKEEVLPIKEGDALALPYRVLTWWLNSSDTELVVLFIGDTSKELQHGSLTNFHRTGSNGSFTGFTPVVIEHAGGLPEDQAKQLASSQTIRSVVKVKDWQKIPEPCSKAREGMVWNCLEAPLDVDIKDGGSVVVLNASNLPFVGKVGLGAYLVRIDGFSIFSPGFSCGSTYQVAYIVRGSGRVQIVGADGKRVLEAHVSDGYLFVVPKFSAVSMIADADGMEWLSIITAANPKVRQLEPVYKVVSPEILEAASNKAPET